MLALVGYLLVIGLSLWLVGPFVGMLAMPILIPLTQRRLRSLGIPVAADLRGPGTAGAWTAEQAAVVRAQSDALGRDAVLFGRALTVGLASALYLQAVIPNAPWYYDLAAFIPVWAASGGRLVFPLLVIGLQLLVRSV